MASGAALLVALICGLVTSAARSDFTFRGCPDIPRSSWEATANCADGWLAQLVFGVSGVALICVAVGLWRWGSAA